MNIFGLLSLEVTARQARLSRVPQALVVGVGIFITTLLAATTLLVVTSTPVQGQAPDPAATTASLTRGSVTITEGHTATIRIRLTGDLSGLNGIDSPFTLSSGPSGNAPEAVEGTDYRLTPIIINIARREATFQIFAIEHPGYDPGLRAMLTLESNSDAIQIGSTSEMRLSIRESTPRPLVSFTADTPFQIDSDGYNYLELIEGESSTFNIELERPFSRDIRVSVFLSGFTPTVSTPGLAAIPVYQDGIVEHPNRGWLADNYQARRGRLTIPAGSSGITFTIDTRAIDNDLYESLDSRSLGSIYFRIEGSLAFANPVSSRLGLRYIEDDTPVISFGNSLLGINSSPEITGREGESFDVWVALENRLRGNFKVEVRLAARVVSGDALRFQIPTVEIVPGELGATVTVTVLEDGRMNNEPRTVALAVERAVLRPTDENGRPGRALGVPSNRMTVKVRDNEPIIVGVKRNYLRLGEGQAGTVTVVLRGDISSLIDGEATLEIKARPVERMQWGAILYSYFPYGPNGTERTRYFRADFIELQRNNDYELTPITINALTREAIFGIRAIDDSEYDPLETTLLEVVSGSDEVEVVPLNNLLLEIDDNDPRPRIRISSDMLDKRVADDGITYPGVLEGEKGYIEVVLDRKSSRDVGFYAFSRDTTPVLFDPNGTPTQVWPASSYTHHTLYEGITSPRTRNLRLLTPYIIPAGSLGLTFTFDTEVRENKFYDYIDQSEEGILYIVPQYVHLASALYDGSLFQLRIFQDEPIPEISFTGTTSDANGNPTITVGEGESFDVWVEISPQLGIPVIDGPGIELEARLNATALTDEAPDLELPNVKIIHHQPGVTVTVRIPDDSLANGQRTVMLDFEDAKVVQPDRPIYNEVAARVGDGLIVKILDDESPVASFDAPTLTLNEGQTGQIKVDLRGDISSRVDSNATLRLEPLPGGTINAASYYELTSPISVGQADYEASFEVRALEDTNYSGNKSVSFRLVSSSDDIPVEGIDQLTLNIIDNDFPRAEFGTTTLTLTEGQRMEIPIEFGGDLSALLTDTLTLRIEQRAGGTPGYGGYEWALTPITVIDGVARATLELTAATDDDYDPDESYVLELVSSSPDLVPVEPNLLNLRITNDDPLPSLSFTSTLPIYSQYDFYGLKIGEGESGQFQVVADRRSNRDLDFGLFLWPGYKSDMIEGIFSAGPEATLPITETLWYLGNPRGWGASTTDVPIEPNLTIRAGELGVTITFDTARLDDEIFEPDYLKEEYINKIFAAALISLDGNSATVFDINPYSEANSSVFGFERIDDDLPPVSLELPSTRSTVAGEPIVVEEGASFDIGVRLDTALLAGFSVQANLTATLIAGPDLSLELPAVTIQEYQSGVTLTVTVHDDAVKDDLRTIRLDLRDALLSNYDPDNERGDSPSEYYDRHDGITPYYNLPLSVTNSLTITVLDNDHPYVLPGTDYLKIPEGQSVTIQIELGGDIRSALGTTLTLSALPDATATADDYRIGPVVIDEQIVQAARATFEIHAIHDQVREPIENVTFKLESDSGAVQVPATTRLTLDIVDYAMPHATFETDLVTLPEGDRATIQIIFGGDIGSLASNTPTLTLRQLPGGNPGYGGYELTETPITIVDGVAHASLELRADNDADYDPGQSFVLELVSSSDALTLVEPNRLTLEIVNDDSAPSASLRGSNPTGITVISALENSVVQFAINLDRRSIDDLELGVFLDDQGSNYDPLNGSANLDQLVFANPEDPTALPLYTDGGDYIDGQGWSQGAMIPEARLLTIPAGSTTLTFTFDATRLNDDLFKSLALKFLGYIRLYVDGVGVTTHQPDSLAAISYIEDDIPTLDLTFDDGNLTSAVREGDQFDIRVNLSNRIENELYEIIAGLTTTLVTGPDFSWQPPDLQIGTGVSGLTLTLTAPNDDLLSGDRTLLLGLEDVVLEDSALGRLVAYTPRKVTLSASNGLTLTVYDDDFPRAAFSTSMLTLEEGRATTVPIQLGGDLRSLADVTTTLMLVQQPGTTATPDDYTPNSPIITIAPGESVATMPISAVDDELYDPGEIVTFKLRSLTDGVFVDPDSVLTLNIVENDPSARLSISALNLREGESAMIAVQLDGDLDLITDDGALQLERQSGTATVDDDYELIAGTIDRATRQVLFEIRAAEDTSYDPGEIVTFRLVASPAEEIKLLGSTELILNIVDDFIYASVTTPEVNLEEGHSATVEIQLEGDLTLLLDEHIALTVTPRPGQTAEGEDYELAPITVDEATSRATVGLLALSDDHYDPAETALLEFGPDTARDNIRWVGSNLVTLNIADNGEEPFISFKGVSADIQTDEPDPYLTVPEGETAHFRAELSRPAEYDIRFMPILSVANEMVAVEGLDAIFTYANASSGYREGEGWSSGSDISEPHSVTIPAGELGVDFSVNTAELDNDSFGFLGTKEITSIYLNVKGSAVRTDRDSSTLTLKYSEDDIPVLSFVDQNFVVTEGDSADISIASRFPLPDGFEIEVTLTTIADATALDLELPTVTIGPSSSPNPVTTFSLETPDDSISNRPGYVIVHMTDAVLKETVWPYRQLPLGVMEELGLNAFDLTIHDNDPATVSLRRAAEYLLEPEGDNLTIGLSLRGDVSSIAGVNDILTIEQQSGDAVEGDDYTLTPIVIIESGSGVAYNSFEIYITDDRYYEPRETAAFVLKSTSPDITVVDLKRFWLTIPANDFLRASLSPSELTLMEGGSATVTVQLDGDLSPLIDGRATLALELLSDATLSNDYTLTPITIDTATSVASFEIFATDDSDYDPGEQIRLGLTSPWDRGYISPPRWLTLNIQDNDEQPLASFTSESDFPTDDDGIPYLQVTEGEQAQFKLELNRKTNYDLRFSVFLDSHLDNSRVNINDLVSTAQLDTIPVDDDHQQQYSEGQGWSPGYDIPESEWLTIPAGESGIDFTFDTAQLDDDLYDFFEQEDIGTIYLALQEAGATIVTETSRLALRYTQDERLPELSFADNGASIGSIYPSVGEGKSYSFSIASSVPIGSDFKIKASLTATVTSGAPRELELPAVEITPGGRWIVLTLQVPDDDRANGDSIVRLKLTDVTLEESVDGATRKHQLETSDEFILQIFDNDLPRAKLTTNQVDLEEGHSATVTVEIEGDTSGVIGDTLELVALSGSSADAADYRIEPSQITINEGQRSVAVTLHANYDREYDPDETVVLKLGLLSGTIRVLPPTHLRVNIQDDSPRAWLGGIPATDDPGQIPLTLREGRSSWITVNLDGARIDSLPPDTLLTLEPQSDQNSADYTILESEITLTDARANARFRIRADNDNIYELTETVVFKLRSSSPDLLITDPSEIVLTIEDTDLLPVISFVRNNPTLRVTEGQSTTIDVAINRPSNFTITVRTRVVPRESEMSRINGYYPEDFDQLISPNQIVIPPGETRVTIVLDTAPIDNSVYNRFERSNSTGYNIGRLQFEMDDIAAMGVDEIEGNRAFRNIFIREDDSQPTLSLTRSRTDQSQTLTVNEGDQFEIWVGLSHPFAETTLMDLTLSPLGGPIIASGTVDIAPGSYGEAITLIAVDDELFTGDRTVVLSLTERIMVMDQFGGGQIRFRNINSFVVTIIDTDPSPPPGD